jgi:hypothetical protein
VVRVSFLAGALLGLGALRAEAADLLSLSVRFVWADVEGAEMKTDRGFTVRLESAEIMSAGFALVPCAEQSAQLASPVVRVGHFSGVLPNQLPLERAESLIARTPFAIDGFDPPDIAYCQAHYVLGGPRGNYSLTLKGRYRAPGSETWTAFSVATPEAYGAFVPLMSMRGRAMTGRLGAIRSIVVQRPMTGWFDGIDFASAQATQIGHAVLRRIANGTVVTVQR